MANTILNDVYHLDAHRTRSYVTLMSEDYPVFVKVVDRMTKYMFYSGAAFLGYIIGKYTSPELGNVIAFGHMPMTFSFSATRKTSDPTDPTKEISSTQLHVSKLPIMLVPLLLTAIEKFAELNWINLSAVAVFGLTFLAGPAVVFLERLGFKLFKKSTTRQLLSDVAAPVNALPQNPPSTVSVSVTIDDPKE